MPSKKEYKLKRCRFQYSTTEGQNLDGVTFTRYAVCEYDCPMM